MLCAGDMWRHDLKVSVYKIDLWHIWFTAIRIGLPADGQARLVGLWSFRYANLIVGRLIGTHIVLDK